MPRHISHADARRPARRGRAVAVALARPAGAGAAPRGLALALALCGLADLAYLLLTHLPR
ncbi:MAG TPA: hypothetical protein VFW96_24595 [Thermomicrobiales bacterium]|nr:hypothetical protein [Thermomicrobiales bacterium]